MSRLTLMLLFLDIDGVLNRNNDRFDPTLVENLNWLMTRWPNLQIVFNTAWNLHPLNDMRDWLVDAGFEHPKRLHGQTAACSGGGNLVRRYLTDNDLVGTPFIIIDDSSHDYNEMWCRLIKCQGRRGFDEDRRRLANDLIWKARAPVEQRDRKLAVSALVDNCFTLSKANYLSEEDKEKSIRLNLDLATHCMLSTDFLVRAHLVKPDEPAESA